MNKKHLIKGYDIFVNGEWDLSPFEHLYELECRDVIQEHINDFNKAEKEEIKKLDKILVKRAPLFYKALKGFLEAERNNKPKSYWWWYLDEIADNKLKPQIN